MTFILASAVSPPFIEDNLVRRFLSFVGHFGSEELVGAKVRMWVDPEGRVIDCKPVAAFRSEEFGERACRFFTRKPIKAAKYEGKGTHADFTSMVFAFPEPTPNYEREMAAVRQALMQPDFFVSVNAIPGAENHTNRTANILVDQTGYVTACEPVHAETDQFDEFACQQVVMQNWPVRTDNRDRPVPYVTTVQVRFERQIEDQEAG